MNPARSIQVRSLAFSDPLHLEACRFLVEEAQILDDCNFDAWLAMLSPEVMYQVRVNATVARGATAGRSSAIGHYDEDFYSLKMRIDRLRTNFAWAEDPPSRTRHVVTNICTYPTDVADEIAVRSYIMLFRSRGDLREPDLLCGAREDRLRGTEGGAFHLVRRDVVLDESVLRTQNLAIFL